METRFEDLATNPNGVKMLYRVEDVAAMLSIGRTAAWELVRTRAIRSVKIGHTRRVPIGAVQDYIVKLLENAA